MNGLGQQHSHQNVFSHLKNLNARNGTFGTNPKAGRPQPSTGIRGDAGCGSGRRSAVERNQAGLKTQLAKPKDTERKVNDMISLITRQSTLPS